jgi:RNA polymerase sigma factor (sigma-70 family)
MCANIEVPTRIECPKERARLAESFEPAVCGLAKRKARAMFPDNPEQQRQAYHEFAQAGRVGVAMALSKYDPSRISAHTGKPIKPFTVAWSWIRQQIQIRQDKMMKEYRAIGRVESLEMKSEDGSLDPISGLAVFDPDGWDATDWHAVLRRLPPRHREVIRMRYQEQRTLKEVAVAFKVSTSRVQQLEKRALAWLRAVPSVREMNVAA